MIKRFFVLFAVVCMLAYPLTALADAIIDNDFLRKNEHNTKKIGDSYNGERFFVNSPTGYVVPRVEPGSAQGVSTEYSYRGNNMDGRNPDKPYTFEGDVFIFKNGEIITITHTYFHNGRYWGVMPVSHTYQPPGWIPMDELLVAFDRRDFETIAKGVFYNYMGSSDAVLSSERLVLWQWPGSDREKRILDGEYFTIKDVIIHRAYKDEDGREWGLASIDIEYVYSVGISEEILSDTYWERHTDTTYLVEWICLSDPENSNIPSFNPAPKPVYWSPDGIYDEAADVIVWPPADNLDWPPSEPTDDSLNWSPDGIHEETADTTVWPPAESSDNSFSIPLLIIPVAVVAVVIIGVAFLIFVLWKKRKPNPETKDDD